MTGGSTPSITAAPPGDYSHLALGEGLPVWLGSSSLPAGAARSGVGGKPRFPLGPNGENLNSPTTPAEALAGGTMFGLNTVVNAAAATAVNNVGAGAYRVVFEQNLNGAIRARVTTYQMAVSNGSRTIVPEGVLADTHGRPFVDQIVRYQPSSPMPFASPQPNVHVLDHFRGEKWWEPLFNQGSNAPVPVYFGSP